MPLHLKMATVSAAVAMVSVCFRNLRIVMREGCSAVKKHVCSQLRPGVLDCPTQSVRLHWRWQHTHVGKLDQGLRRALHCQITSVAGGFSDETTWALEYIGVYCY